MPMMKMAVSVLVTEGHFGTRNIAEYNRAGTTSKATNTMLLRANALVYGTKRGASQYRSANKTMNVSGRKFTG